MVRASNTLICLLSFFSIIVAIPLLGTAWLLAKFANTECQKILALPLLVLGGFLLFVSLLGLIGSCCGVSFLLWFYLFLTFMLILGQFAFTIFSIVVTNKGVGKAIAGTGYMDYKLGDYSNWLQTHVVDSSNWVHIRSCLLDSHVCNVLRYDANQQAAHFYHLNLSPVQSGCCKPPTYCGFTFKNATFWETPKSGPAVPDSDCKTWSNNPEALCYDCKSCKAGILATVQSESRRFNFLNICIIIFLLMVYSIGCCALRNNEEKYYFRRF